MENQVDMRVLRKKIKEVLESYNLPTRRFGIVITVNPEEFAILADEHPNLIHPEMLFFSETDEMGSQSFVQIQKQHEP